VKLSLQAEPIMEFDQESPSKNETIKLYSECSEQQSEEVFQNRKGTFRKIFSKFTKKKNEDKKSQQSKIMSVYCKK